MAVLYGWQRKVAMLPLNLFVLGWVIYSIGLIWVLVQWSDDYSSEYGSRHSPLLYSYFVVLVGGPFVYLLGVAQAILPGIASSIVGILTAFVSTIFLVSAGAITYGGGVYINGIVTSDHVTADSKEVLMFVGAIFATICWCFVMMLSTSYKSKPKRNSNHYDLFDQTNGSSGRKCKAPFTPGVARGLSIPFIILTGVGWCVYVVGIDRWHSDNPLIQELPLLHLSVYGAVVIGPLLLLAALLHAGCSGGASSVMGVFTSILSTVYVVFMGFIVNYYGGAFYTVCQIEVLGHKVLNCSPLHSSLNINLIYIFSGGVGSLFFWTFVLALWPFYRNRPQQGQGSNVINYSSNPHYGTMRLEESFSNPDTYSSQPLTRENGKH